MYEGTRREYAGKEKDTEKVFGNRLEDKGRNGGKE